MHYQCSCGYSATTATTFYRHLASSKDSGAVHQLVQAKFTERSGTSKQIGEPGPSTQVEAVVGAGVTARASGSTEPNWVDEYLVVEATGRAAAPVPAPQTDSSAAPAPQTTAHPAPSPSKQLPVSNHATTTRPEKIKKPAKEYIEEVDCTQQTPGKSKPSATRMSRIWKWLATPSTSKTGQPPQEHEEQKDAVQQHTQHIGTSTSQHSDSLLERLELAGEEGLEKRISSSKEAGTSAAAMAGGNVDALARAEQPHELSTRYHNALGTVASSTERLERLLTWTDPWASARAFGGGLYLIICFKQLAMGSQGKLLPSTVLFAASFLLLLRNVLVSAVRAYKAGVEAASVDDAEAGDSAPTPYGRAAALMDSSQHKLEAALVTRAQVLLRPAAEAAIEHACAALVLALRLLSGRHAITSALVATALWLGMVMSELRIMGQATFWAALYVCLFTAPPLYLRSRAAMDSAIEGALRCAARALIHAAHNRNTLALAGGASVALMALLPMNLVLRASAAVLGGFAVLLWQAQAHAGVPAAAAA